MELIAFILASVAIIIIPGPNVLVIVSTGISHGQLRGLQTVAGTSAAMILQLVIAALGTAWFVSALSSGFIVLKWAGVVYLVYLGITHVIASFDNSPTKRLTAVGSFKRGFWVSLTNPKTILFFSAFIPQFTTAGASYFQQTALLSLVFLCLAVVIDSAYALLSSKLRGLIRNNEVHTIQCRISGLVYLSAGATLASIKNGQ